MKREITKETKSRKPSGSKLRKASATIPFEVGRAYFIRTVTYHLTGRVTRIIGSFLLLEEAAWIADSGRFTQAIKSGNLNEVEPVGEAILNIDTVTDAFPWNHPLPKEQR